MFITITVSCYYTEFCYTDRVLGVLHITNSVIYYLMDQDLFVSINIPLFAVGETPPEGTLLDPTSRPPLLVNPEVQCLNGNNL